MARPERFELPTNWFEASYSIQLSYGRITQKNFIQPLKALLSDWRSQLLYPTKLRPPWMVEVPKMQEQFLAGRVTRQIPKILFRMM